MSIRVTGYYRLSMNLRIKGFENNILINKKIPAVPLLERSCISPGDACDQK